MNGPPRNISPAQGSRVGDDLVEAFEQMASHLRGEIQLQAQQLPGGALTPAEIKAIRLKVASSTREFERLFGIPARTMEAYEQGRRNLDGAMRALLRIIDRERFRNRSSARSRIGNGHVRAACGGDVDSGNREGQLGRGDEGGL